MSRILLATHGGAGADAAVRVAGELARRRQATLQVMGVLIPSTPLALLDTAGMGMVPPPEDYEHLAEALRAEVAGQLARCGVPAHGVTIAIGAVAPEIAAAARAGGADLVVIGLGPHNIVDRALGNETALQLVQLAATPVLAVPADAAPLSGHAVAAVDFTPTSVHAARAAARCLAAGDVLDLVHVVPQGLPAGDGSRLRDLASHLAVPSGVEVVAVELQGEPARSLLDYAETCEADLMAMGSHGYGLWKRLTLGSVVSKVVRLARFAVLVAPIGSISVPG